MFTQKNVNSYCFTLSLISSILLTGCSGGSGFSGFGLGGGKKTSASANSTSASAVDTATNSGDQDGLTVATLNQMSYEEISKVSMIDYYEAGLKSATNDPVEIGGQTFVGVKSFLENNRANYRALADEYPTVGDYLAKMAILSDKDILPEEVEGGWATIAKAFSEGTLEIPGQRAPDAGLRLQEIKNEVGWENGERVNNVTIGIGNEIQPGQEIHIDPSAYAALVAPESMGGEGGAQTVNRFTMNVAPNMPPGSKLVLDMPAEGEKNITFNQGQFGVNMTTDGHQVTWNF